MLSNPRARMTIPQIGAEEIAPPAIQTNRQQ